MTTSEDHQLVARVVSGQDVDAFGELIRRHQSHVRNFLRKLTGDYALADDLAQDCFMHAWDKLHTFSGRGSFIGWLLKVAYTTFLQSKRKSKRYAEILEEVGHATDTDGPGYTSQSDETGDPPSRPTPRPSPASAKAPGWVQISASPTCSMSI